MDKINLEIEKIKRNLSSYSNPDVLKACLSFIDLTTLNSTDTPSKVAGLADKVNSFKRKFPLFPNVASICVYPNFAPLLKERLTAQGVNITVVGGCFPSSQSFIEVKTAECRMAVEKGADEVDVVLPLNSLLDGDCNSVTRELKLIREATKGAHLKVILETGALTNYLTIEKAADIAMDCGADFIKTSTGKMEPAATPEAVFIMCTKIKERYNNTGKKTGIKPAGGISSSRDALLYYAIVDNVLGKDWLTPSLFRLGASRLANNILSELSGETISFF